VSKCRLTPASFSTSARAAVKGSNLSPAIAAYFALMALLRARRSSQGIAALNLSGDGFTEPMFFQVIVRTWSRFPPLSQP